MPSSRSSQPRDQTHVSCTGRHVLYHQCHLGIPSSIEMVDLGPNVATTVQTISTMSPWKLLDDLRTFSV